jgi:hypothetical protein
MIDVSLAVGRDSRFSSESVGESGLAAHYQLEVLARCTELRALQVALVLVHDDFVAVLDEARSFYRGVAESANW